MRPKHPVIAGIRAVLATVLVVYIYIAFVHVTTTDRSRVSQLAIKHSGVTGVSPTPSSTQVLDVTSSPFKAVLNASKTDPGQVAGYSTIWNGPPKSERSAVMVLDFLPSHEQAQQVISQANQEFFSEKAFKQYSKEVKFEIPEIPGSTAYHLYSAATPQNPASQSVMTVFGFGRVAVVCILSGLVMQPSEGVTISTREYNHLQVTEPSFYLTYQTRPVWLTVLYVIGAILFVAFAFFGPTAIVETRRRRKEEREAAVRRHYQVRGNKVLRRQRAPSYRR